MDKVANWARQGSMWPMTFGKFITGTAMFLAVLNSKDICQDSLAVQWK